MKKSEVAKRIMEIIDTKLNPTAGGAMIEGSMERHALNCIFDARVELRLLCSELLEVEK